MLRVVRHWYIRQSNAADHHSLLGGARLDGTRRSRPVRIAAGQSMARGVPADQRLQLSCCLRAHRKAITQPSLRL